MGGNNLERGRKVKLCNKEYTCCLTFQQHHVHLPISLCTDSTGFVFAIHTRQLVLHKEAYVSIFVEINILRFVCTLPQKGHHNLVLCSDI